LTIARRPVTMPSASLIATGETTVRPKFRTSLVVAVLLASTACAPGDPEEVPGTVDFAPASALVPLPSPAGPGASAPRLFAGVAAAWMSWIEPSANGHSVRVAALRGNDWSAPRTVIEADDLFVNWADFPSLVETTDGDLLVHWLQRSGPGTYAYDVRVSRSSDGGGTWSQPFSPHDDGTLTEHGFATLVPERDGSVTAVWLDGRQTGAGGPMSLRSARIGPGGEVTEARQLDGRTCDCCQTGATRIGEDLLVVYRDRSDEEVRDIWSVARRDGQWQAPQRLSYDEWMIPGCPVNGPVVVARGNRVAVGWFALVDGSPEVKAAFSDDGGRTFAAPMLLERGQPDAATLGRVDAGWIDDDTAIFSWLTGIGEEGEIRYQMMGFDGTTQVRGLAGTTRSSRSSGFPRLAVQQDRVLFAWTTPDSPAPIHLAALDLR